MSAVNLRLAGVSAITIAVAFALAAGATGAPERSVGTLEIDATFRNFWRLDRSYCPPGTPPVSDCLQAVGDTAVPGLGRATLMIRKVLPNNDENCFMIQNNTALIEIAGKGSLELLRPGKICVGPPPREDGPYTFAVKDGTGKYARASGSFSNRTSVYAGDGGCRCGYALETWKGTLTVPDFDFDTTAPTITGAASKTVKAPKQAKKARVRYVVKATDAVDGTVAVTCKPRSGSLFKRGRTTVRCFATDSSANTRGAKFTVTVK